MNTRPWSTVERIFHEVLEGPEETRAARLAKACGGDQELQREVQSLLDQASQIDFLEEPALQVAASMVSESGDATLVGRLIGVYQVQSLLGQGGMGEVYRARDMRLDRDVAIKVLPRAFTGDPDRLARFEREAKMLAALNHPHIGGIYGIEESAGVRALVLELVEGDTLADRIERGPVPVNDALTWARQMADALDAAHEKGIVHRDLKPSNVKITPNGVVKVLDFGLARANTTEGGLDGLRNSPTITVEGSVLLGTAAYMSPEQARGQVVDKRTDVWAFGCVLFEMLTGRPAFAAPTVSDTLAAILQREPEWDALPAGLPPAVGTLLRRCLEKEVRHRRRDIGDVRSELDTTIARPESAGKRAPAIRDRSTPGNTLPWIVAAVAVVAAAVGFWPDSQWQNPLADARYEWIANSLDIETDAAISPDGTLALFLSNQKEQQFHFWRIQIETRTAEDLTPLSGNLRFSLAGSRSHGFDGDGSHIWTWGFSKGDRQTPLSRPLIGGPVTSLSHIHEKLSTIDWLPQTNQIVFKTWEKGDPIYVAEPSGLNRKRIFISDGIEGDNWLHNHGPLWSRDGQWIYLIRGRPETGELNVWRFRESDKRLEQLTHNRWDTGWLTWLNARTLLYVGRDEDRTGPSLWALDVESKISHRVTPPLDQYTSISADRDGKRLVASVAKQQSSLWTVPILTRVAESSDVHRYDPSLRVQALSPRVGRDALFYLSAFGARDGLWKFQGGEPEQIWDGSQGAVINSPAESRDGHLAFAVKMGQSWVLTVKEKNGGIRTLATSIDVRGFPAWSPDGRWIAVGGINGEGMRGLFKIPLDGGPAVTLVSKKFVTDPTWSNDGDLIVYAGQDEAAKVPLGVVRLSDRSEVKLPQQVFGTPGLARPRFLPDGSGVIFVATDPNLQDNTRLPEFWLLDLKKGVTRQLTRIAGDTTRGEIRGFDLTPDGKQIVFERLVENSDIQLITLPDPATR